MRSFDRMSRRSLPLLLALSLAWLAPSGVGAKAQGLVGSGAVAVQIERAAAARAAPEAPREPAQPKIHPARVAWVTRVQASVARPAHVGAPRRPLYLLHRALLR